LTLDPKPQVALADLEPKEKSKRKQISDREAKVIVANRLLRKANERTLALEARLDAANAAMEEHRIKVSTRKWTDSPVNGGLPTEAVIQKNCVKA
jgi:hypothetical protein